MDAFGKLLISIAEEMCEDEQVVTLKCLTEFCDFKDRLMKTYAVYLKPANTPDSNIARQKELYTQRSELLSLVRKFEKELLAFTAANPIPKEILYQIEKE